MSSYGKKYDVIVVGAGHAGCEAALASARMGCLTLLLTIGLDSVAQMSCNPSIGGLAKGHLVSEIDALGGEMGKNIDATGIQFRRLNTRKGPAVRANRAQADRMAYSARMKKVVESEDNLDLKQGMVSRILVSGGGIEGVETREGLRFLGRSVVLTTGTFMGGLIHIGLNHYSGGRAGEPSSEGLSESLGSFGFKVGRLKTGTPARLSAKTIDFSRLEVQPGDAVVRPFSFLTDKIERRQVVCHIANTNEKTHEIIRKGLDRSPLYAGIIEGVGPRYCPSIEDKIVRFPDKKSHQSFLEPEGYDGIEMYPSGLSTSLPADVQQDYFRSMVGFENVELMRPGYGIEYDFIEPLQLKNTLETKAIAGLYHAGQINGTSGYEEAAGQGLIAGINAARRHQGRDPLIIRRDQGYIGVMIDDLVTQPTIDPYRMFTSRAEYRLLLREDNADVRLTPVGREIGLVDDERWRLFNERQDEVSQLTDYLKSEIVTPKNKSFLEKIKVSDLKAGISLEKMLKRPEIELADLAEEYIHLQEFGERASEKVEVSVKYSGYIERQVEQVGRAAEYDLIDLPEGIDYTIIPSLSSEVREKLSKIKPSNLGQAGRIQGVTPAAIAVLHVYLKKKQIQKDD